MPSRLTAPSGTQIAESDFATRGVWTRVWLWSGLRALHCVLGGRTEGYTGLGQSPAHLTPIPPLSLSRSAHLRPGLTCSADPSPAATPPFPPCFSETPAPDPCRTPTGTPHLEFGELTPRGNPQPTRQKTTNQHFLWSEVLGAPGGQRCAPRPASPLLFTASPGLPPLLPGTTSQAEHAGYAHTRSTLMEPCGDGM